MSDDAGWDCHVHVFDAAVPVRAGHYRPEHRPLAQIEAVAHAHGVHHLVLVQPSVYGTDNGVLLRALALEPGRHRGVAVVADDVSDAELDALHAHGVRGVRINRVSPVGAGGWPGPGLAARLQRLGWHLQWYVGASSLAEVAAWHRAHGGVCVLDHLAGFTPAIAADDAAWGAVDALARQGAWLKLSGWYRLDAQAPYATLLAPIRRLAALFGERLVWGSDWPHTMFDAQAMPSYASTWQPVPDALGCEAAAALRRRRPAIYA